MNHFVFSVVGFHSFLRSLREWKLCFSLQALNANLYIVIYISNSILFLRIPKFQSITLNSADIYPFIFLIRVFLPTTIIPVHHWLFFRCRLGQVCSSNHDLYQVIETNAIVKQRVSIFKLKIMNVYELHIVLL